MGYCPCCGQKITENDSQFCVNCGYKLVQPNVSSDNNHQAQSYTPQENNFNVDSQVYSTNTINNGVQSNYSNGIGIAGFVISLVSLLCCCGSLSWLSLIFSIMGLKSSKEHNGVGNGLSLAGLIISIIGFLIILMYFFIFMLAFLEEIAFLV